MASCARLRCLITPLVALQNGDAGVGRAEVNADDLCHFLCPQVLMFHLLPMLGKCD